MERATGEAAERPVFVAETGRRASALRVVACGIAAVTGAWLIALVLGAAGLGRLPAVPLPPIGALHEPDRGDPAAAPSSPHRPDRSPPSHASSRGSVAAPPLGRRRHGPASRTPAPSASPRPGRTVASTPPPASQAPPAAPTSTTSTGSDHAPTLTPSGNTVPAGTTGAGSVNRPFAVPPGHSR